MVVRKRAADALSAEERRLLESRRAKQLTEKRAAAARQSYIRIDNRTAQLIEDPDQLIEWTDEELMRGYQGNKPPKDAVIPRAVYGELWKRTTSEAMERMRASVPEGVSILMEIANNKDAKDADRIKAISIILDRVLGKVPDRMLFAETSADGKPKWAGVLDVAIVSEDDPEG